MDRRQDPGSEFWREHALSNAFVQHSKLLAVMFRHYASRGKSPNTGAFIFLLMLHLMNSVASNGTYRSCVEGALSFIHVCVWCESAWSSHCRESCLWLWGPSFCWENVNVLSSSTRCNLHLTVYKETNKKRIKLWITIMMWSCSLWKTGIIANHWVTLFFLDFYNMAYMLEISETSWINLNAISHRN